MLHFGEKEMKTISIILIGILILSFIFIIYTFNDNEKTNNNNSILQKISERGIEREQKRIAEDLELTKKIWRIEI